MSILSAEIYKIKKDKLFWGTIIYTFLALLTMAGKEINLGNGMQTVGLSVIFHILNSKEMFIYISYITMIYACKIISDFNSGYFMDVIAIGNDRVKLWFSKLMIHSFFSSCLCIVPIISLAVGGIILGEGINDDFEFGKFIILILLTFCVSFFESFLFSSLVICLPKVKVIIIIIIATNLLVQTPILFNMFTDFYKWTIFASLVNLCETNICVADVLRIIFVSSYTFVIAFIIAKLGFLKKEL